MSDEKGSTFFANACSFTMYLHENVHLIGLINLRCVIVKVVKAYN